MRAGRPQAALLQEQHTVGEPDRGQAVRDDDQRGLQLPPKAGQDLRLDRRIHGARGVVQDQHSGCRTNARASATRCRSPPESVCPRARRGQCRRRGGRADEAVSLRDRGGALDLVPARAESSAMFSTTLAANRKDSWNTSARPGAARPGRDDGGRRRRSGSALPTGRPGAPGAARASTCRRPLARRSRPTRSGRRGTTPRRTRKPSKPYVSDSARTSSGPGGSEMGSAVRVIVSGCSRTSRMRPWPTTAREAPRGSSRRSASATRAGRTA